MNVEPPRDSAPCAIESGQAAPQHPIAARSPSDGPLLCPNPANADSGTEAVAAIAHAARTFAALAFAILGATSLVGCAQLPRRGESDATAIELRYIVTADVRQPLRLKASVDLSPVVGKAQTVQLRVKELGLLQQVATPRCDDRELRSTGDATWDLPADCRRLSWLIYAQEVPASGADASAQQTLYFPDGGWWLISEPTSLLHLSDIPPSVPRTLHFGSTEAGRSRRGGTRSGASWRIPAMDQAPEYFAVGDVALDTREIGGVSVSHVLDDPQRLATLSLQTLHAQAFSYLTHACALPPPPQSAPQELMVIWLGISTTRGELGGAAGGRSLLVNYPRGDHANDGSYAARTLLLVAHEQAHQLHEYMRGDAPPLPAWMSESLAHYCALKALAHSELPPGTTSGLFARFVDVDRPVEAGLLEQARRHTLGDPEAYGRFYTQGATFWSEVDRLLMPRSPRSGGLSELLPDILSRGGRVQGDAGPLRELLGADGNPDMQALIDRYVDP